MHYSPSEKDGVFVVEVARGADTSYHSPRTGIAPQQPTFNGVDLLNNSLTPAAASSATMPDASSHGGNLDQQQQQQQQRVQVHHHPPPAEEAMNGTLKSSTGLSQSDLSDSSSGTGSNKDYNYGSQGGVYGEEQHRAGAVAAGNVVHQQAAAAVPQHPHRSVAKQETIDLEPRLQSDIDLFNVETERREHCNGHGAENSNSNGRVLPDILVKSSAVHTGGAPIDQSVES